MNVERVTIIGAGPAGIATAIQLKRFGITPVVLERNKIGGLLRNAHLVENYPGFPTGISGLDLVNLFETQLEMTSINVCSEEVIKLDINKGLFCITTQKRNLYSQIVVIASGTKPKEFLACQLSKEVKDKIFYEIAPILNVKGKKIIIVGAGDAAFDYALNIEKNNRVVMLNRGETVRCLPLLLERAKKSPRITSLNNIEITKITSGPKNKVILDCISSQGFTKLDAHYIVLALGREPHLDFLSKKIRNHLQVLEMKGVLYFVGDVKNTIFRQTAISVGNGIMTAMKINKRLKELPL